MKLDQFITSSFDFTIQEYELQVRVKALNVMLLLIAMLLSLMTVVRFVNAYPHQGTVNLLFAILSVFALFWMRGNKNRIGVVARLTCLSAWVVSSSLFLNVPEDTLRIVWFLVVLPPVFFLCGSKFGVFISILSFFVVIILHAFGQSGYSDYEIFYFTTLSCVVTLFLFFYEYKGSKHRERLQQYNRELEDRVIARTLDLQKEQEQLKRYISAVDDLSVGLCVIDADYRIRIMNKTLIGWFGDRRGHSCYSTIQEEESPCSGCKLKNVVEQGKLAHYQFARSDGRTYEIVATPISNRDGTTSKMELIHDITEQKEQEKRRLETIRQAEQLKKLASLKTMAGAIAHRFNNAMMAVQGNLELMRLTLPDDSNEYRMASSAYQAASGASQIGSMMLSYVGQAPLQLQELSLSPLVWESVMALEERIQSSISLNFTPPDQPIYCAIDQQQIKEVIESILNNAFESLDDSSGSVNISFGTDYFTADSFPISFQDNDLKGGRYVFCQIQDSGQGIRQDDLARIFEPFYTTRFVGRGLGLALTVGIMQTHHGAITIESTPEQGTTARVLLPAISSPAQPAILSSADVSGKAVQLSGDILLADDEPIVLITVKMMLEQLGFTVHTAVDGQEAVNKVRSREIDFCAVLLDVLMPVMNGIEAMKEIKNIAPAIPILFISGYSEDNLMFEGDKRNKPDSFITKPVMIANMRSKLENLLS